MRKVIFFILLILSFSSFAQSLKTPLILPEDSIDIRKYYPQRVRNVIKTNPLMMIWGPVMLTSEIRLMNEIVTSKKQAVQIGFSYYGKSPLLLMVENDSVYTNNNSVKLAIQGFRFQLQNKFYLSNKGYSPKGFYVSPHLSYSSVKFSTKFFSQYDNFIQITQFDINLLAGIQFIKRHFAFDLFWGVGYKRNIWTEFQSPNSIRNIPPPDNMPFANLYKSPFKFTIGFNVGAAF